MIHLILKRMTAKTPVFFKKLRKTGLVLTAISAGILAGPVALPAIIIKIAGYLAVADSVMAAVSQTAIKRDN